MPQTIISNPDVFATYCLILSYEFCWIRKGHHIFRYLSFTLSGCKDICNKKPLALTTCRKCREEYLSHLCK